MSTSLLPGYSDSDSDSDADSPAAPPANPLKRKRAQAAQDAKPRLPPLPATFHDLYTTNARVSTSDDPSLHSGRKRAVPHIDGNWPTHVYLEWVPSQAEFQQLNSLIDHVRSSIESANSRLDKALPLPDIHPSLLSDLGTPVPLHISLSRTLQIKTDQRESFLEVLTSSFKKAAVRPFDVRFTRLKWVSNYQRNRWFLILGIEKPAQDELNRLLNACNDAAEQCGHPPLYVGGRGDGPMEDNDHAEINSKKRKSTQTGTAAAANSKPNMDRSENYHVSIAWNLEEPATEWRTLAQDVDVSSFIQSPQAAFDVVKARIGNVVNAVGLDPRKSSSVQRRGLLGLG